MDDLISRQAAIEALKRAEALTRAFGYHNVIDTIRELPTAEPEIIKCKECLMHGFCRFEQGLGLDGYCSQAERRSDD